MPKAAPRRIRWICGFRPSILQPSPGTVGSVVRGASSPVVCGRGASPCLWSWSESLPRLLFLTVRESSVGATRLRYVEAALMTITREYYYYDLQSVALAPLTGKEDWPSMRPVVDYCLSACPLEIVVYEPE